MKKQMMTTAAATLLVLTAVSGTAAYAVEGDGYTTNGAVEFTPSTDPTSPVNPDNPDPNVPIEPFDPTDPDGPRPGTDGPLSIDYASSLDFGLNKISNKDEIYFARAQSYKTEDTPSTANYVQISDNRGSNAGWVLKVKQNSQFTSTTETLNDTLIGAEITFDEPYVASNSSATEPIATKPVKLTPDGAECTLVTAIATSGAGTWITKWGSVETIQEKDEDGNDVETEVTKDIHLSVPGSTPKDAVKYTTTLTWNLSDVPTNE